MGRAPHWSAISRLRGLTTGKWFRRAMDAHHPPPQDDGNQMTEQLAPDERPAAVVVPGPWGERDASWAFTYELPASVEYGMADDAPEALPGQGPDAGEAGAGW